MKTGSTDVVRIPVDPDEATFCFTNIDDVAAGIELAIDKLDMINGTSVHPVFDLVGDRFPIMLLFEVDGKIFGCKWKIELYKPEGTPFLEAIGGTKDASATRAKTVLGWKVRRGEFVHNTHLYANSFLAALAIAA